MKTELSDQEINALVAEKVAGWRNIQEVGYERELQGKYEPGPLEPIPDYVNSADAVLPLLEKHCRVANISFCTVSDVWSVEIVGNKHEWYVSGDSCDPLSRVLCYALLKSKGIEL